MIELRTKRGLFPQGLKPGDFIQTSSHFGDIFFEVQSCFGPLDPGGYWHVTYSTYAKYSGKHDTQWVNGASSIRAVIPAEMAVPVMLFKGLRFKASFGQYDPFYGFAPVGVPLRNRGTL